MSRPRVFIVGNGLSIGFDPNLASPKITRRVLETLGSDAALLRELARRLAPDLLEAADEDFEKLAGPVDRLSETLGATEILSRLARPQDQAVIKETIRRLRKQYLRIVGSVLSDIDLFCRPGDAERWVALNAFARRLLEEHASNTPLVVFTLNYDSLLHSSLLNERSDDTPYIYDGFRGGTLDQPLDPRGNPCLYYLHGSISWVSRRGDLEKLSLDDIRESGRLRRWSAGSIWRGRPVVVLGDQKQRMAVQHPFSVFYRELDGALANADYVVVAGYGFGDLPVNAALARHLAATDRKLNVWIPWRPGVSRKEEILNRLCGSSGAQFSDGQVCLRNVRLPATNGFERIRR